eukprot:8158257-Pyramimonas_sp.AAC.1
MRMTVVVEDATRSLSAEARGNLDDGLLDLRSLEPARAIRRSCWTPRPRRVPNAACPSAVRKLNGFLLAG